jgi:cytochrome c biogenesis protein CcmG/thiol:disulfide interchange protein DsbE
MATGMTDSTTEPEPVAEAEPVTDTEPVSGMRRARRALWIAVAIGAVMAAFVVVLATRPPATNRAVKSPLLGKPAPAIDAPTVDGGHVNIADFRGRWVLVNYFATWCVPCRQEHPDLIRFHEHHQAIGDAQVIGVVFADSFDAVREFRRDNGGTWPMAEDPDGRIAIDWGVTGVPESFLVDPTGIVRAKVLGGVSEARLDQLLVEAAGGTG